MKNRLSSKKLNENIRSRNRVDALAGILVLIPAVLLTITIAFSLIDTPNTWLLEGTTTTNPYDGLIAAYILRLLPLGLVLVMCLTSYLLLESHSLGIKVSIILSVFFFIAAGTNTTNIGLSILSGVLCIVGAITQFIHRRQTGTKKDNPMVTEEFAKFGLRIAGFICIAVLVGIIVYIAVRGMKYVSWDFLTSQSLTGGYVEMGKRIAGITEGTIGGIRDFIIGSGLLVGVCEVIAIPLGVGAAIYLSEYAPKNRFVEVIRFFTETLAGAPSIVLGLFGAAVFVFTLGWGWSLAAGGLSLAFMILPWNIRVTEEAMRAVPQSYREAAYALGATKWQTIRKTVLLPASPGTITGIMLGVGAALGETAVVLWTASQAGAVYFLPEIVPLTHQQIPNLATWIYGSFMFISTGLPTKTNMLWEAQNATFAGAFVLVVLFLIITVSALVLRNYLAKKTGAM